MSKNKLISMKRITRDISEIKKNPIKGIGIIQYEDDFMKYIVNIRLLNGIYQGYCLQLLLTFSEYYPTKPPKIQIFPNQAFNQVYHHHIFDDSNGFKKFCFDLLDNDFMNINEANTGWNPSYTISTLLLQVQNFLSDPDMSKDHLPNSSQIQFLMDSLNNYVRTFVDENGNEIVHTWVYPYPPIFGFENNEKIIEEKKEENCIDIPKNEKNDICLTNSSCINSSNNNTIKDEKNEKKEPLKEDNKNIINENGESEINKNKIYNDKDKINKDEEIKQNLTCFLLRVNIFDDKDIALGYPLKQLKALGDKIECVPIPEVLSYEGYISQIAKQDEKLDDYFNVTFKAANNEYYNYWLPIYINEEHFQRNKILILNSFSVLKYGAKGKKEYDFKPEHIFEYLPNLLNKMICGMFNQKSYMSEAYIRCYFQYLFLFKKLIEEFKDEFTTYLNNILSSIKKNKYIVNKTIVPDIGNLFMLLYFSDIELDKKMWDVLFEEKMVRKMYWTFHFSNNVDKIKKIFEEYGAVSFPETNKKILEILKNENLYYYEYLENIENNNKYQPCVEECLFSFNSQIIKGIENIKPKKGLFDECIQKGIFDKIIEIISKEIIKKPKSLNDIFGQKIKKKDSKIDDKIKNETKLRIINEFPIIYKKDCSSSAQKKIDQLLLKKIDLRKYCSISLIEKEKIKPTDFFQSNEVDKLMKKIDKKYHLEVTKKIYETSRGNLLTITTLAQMKINEPGFMEELSKNYGVFIKAVDFIKEINKKLEEIQCYKDLFNFMKSDIINKDEDEYERIIKCYQKAKEKRYIKPSMSEIIKSIEFSRGKNNINKNANNKNGPNRNNNNNFRNNRNNRNNRNIRNNNIESINRINSNNNDNRNNNNGRRKNNFNSHFVDLDEFLGE